MNTIIIAISSVTILGAIAAALLAIASKVMHVAVDERITRIQESLPGSNCGACGFPGCAGYADAVVNGGAKSNLCTPGGAAVVTAISEILGIQGEAAVKKLAVIHCCGDNETHPKKMTYQGIETCYAMVNSTYAGESACAYGCLGHGDCKKVCPEDAIFVENGLAYILAKHCTGCGMCVKACPNNIITIEDGLFRTRILCSSLEKGAAARKRCSHACLACSRCVKECPKEAVVVENNLAKINYEKCIDCGHCATVCPTKCIQVA